ncbi:unnamed protein product [Allacma fusca]|uniref:Methyltransferase FkbM domain-containing protein n=2 Tax=Allacma fusca TaxID=39272 RepID=A0A8J2LNZ9_9HEXA|nr:unnamed protein product [Allacma fusca]
MRLRYALPCVIVTLALYFLMGSKTSLQPEGQDLHRTQIILTNISEDSPIKQDNRQNLDEEIMRGSLAQNEPRVISYIKNNGYLNPPSPRNMSYHLDQPTRDPSTGQSHIVKRLFNGKRNGFFVECGALDGETRSNTLSLERDYGWQGLLIEGDPKNYQVLLTKKRKAWTSRCCLSIHPYPHEVMFKQDFNKGKIQQDNVTGGSSDPGSSVRAQCFPLFSLLRTLGVWTVDYLSLDVEGFEMDVLKTIPFHLVHIRVLSVEFTHGAGGPEELIAYMRKKNYRVVTKLIHEGNLANDVIFAHKSFHVRGRYPEVMKSELMWHT